MVRVSSLGARSASAVAGDLLRKKQLIARTTAIPTTQPVTCLGDF